MVSARELARRAEKQAAKDAEDRASFSRFIERFECGSLRQIYNAGGGARWFEKGWWDPEYVEEKEEEEGKDESDGDNARGSEEKKGGEAKSASEDGASTTATTASTAAADDQTIVSALTLDPSLPQSSIVTSVEGPKTPLKSPPTPPPKTPKAVSIVESTGPPPKTAPGGGNDPNGPNAGAVNTGASGILRRRRSSLPPASPKSLDGPQTVPMDVPSGEKWFGVKTSNGHIVKVDLHENNLSGSLPGSPGYGVWPQKVEVPPFGTTKVLLERLKVFVMFKNDLTGPIPSSYGGFINLQHLDLSYNRLTMMPEEIFTIKTMRRIHLEKNHVMEGGIPVCIGELKNLEALTLHYNQLSGMIPGEIEGCVKLREFSVHHNLLTGNASEFLPGLSRLSKCEVLFLNNNDIDIDDPVRAEKVLREGCNFRSWEKLCIIPQHVQDDTDSEDDETTEGMTIDGTHTTEGND